MFVIFGWERAVKPLETILKVNCYHCQNHAGWSIWKETEWFSLFFIKVLPFINKYYLSCDICGDSVHLTSEQAKHAMNRNKRSKTLHDNLVENIESHQFNQLTEGQIVYRKAQFENR